MGDVVNMFVGDERFSSLTVAILDTVYERGTGLPLPAVIGCLEIVKAQILKNGG